MGRAQCVVGVEGIVSARNHTHPQGGQLRACVLRVVRHDTCYSCLILLILHILSVWKTHILPLRYLKIKPRFHVDRC
jgi:hypothetical protein